MNRNDNLLLLHLSVYLLAYPSTSTSRLSFKCAYLTIDIDLYSFLLDPFIFSNNPLLFSDIVFLFCQFSFIMIVKA